MTVSEMTDLRVGQLPPHLVAAVQQEVLQLLTDNAETLAARCTALCIQQVWAACLASTGGAKDQALAAPTEAALPTSAEVSKIEGPSVQAVAGAANKYLVHSSASWEELPPVLQIAPGAPSENKGPALSMSAIGALPTPQAAFGPDNVSCKPQLTAEEPISALDSKSATPVEESLAASTTVQEAATPSSDSVSEARTVPEASGAGCASEPPEKPEPSSEAATEIPTAETGRPMTRLSAVETWEMAAAAESDAIELLAAAERRKSQARQGDVSDTSKLDASTELGPSDETRQASTAPDAAALPCSSDAAAGASSPRQKDSTEQDTESGQQNIEDVSTEVAPLQKADSALAEEPPLTISPPAVESALQSASPLTISAGDPTMEHELEALQEVVALLTSQLRTLCEEAGVDKDSALPECREQGSETPTWGMPVSVSYLVRWYVGHLTCRAAAGSQWPSSCCGSAKESAVASAAEEEGVASFATELHAFEEWFHRGVSTAAVLLDLRDHCSGP